MSMVVVVVGGGAGGGDVFFKNKKSHFMLYSHKKISSKISGGPVTTLTCRLWLRFLIKQGTNIRMNNVGN